MEKFMRGIPNVIVYIDNLLTHSKNHKDHLVYLEWVLQRLQENRIKLNIENCFFSNTEVSYRRFVLTPEGIKLGRDKLKAIKAAQPPMDMKAVWFFIGLWTFSGHISIILQQSALLSQNLQGKIWDTMVDHFQQKHSMLSWNWKGDWWLIQLWHIQGATGNMCL